MSILKAAFAGSFAIFLAAPAIGNPAVGWTPTSFADTEAVSIAYQLKPRKQIAGATVKLAISDANGNLLYEDSAQKDFPVGFLSEVKFQPVPALGTKTPGTKLVVKVGIVSPEQVWTNQATRTITKQCKQPSRGSQATKGADARVECRWSGFKRI